MGRVIPENKLRSTHKVSFRKRILLALAIDLQSSSPIGVADRYKDDKC